MKKRKWYQETGRKDDVSHFSSSSRMSDFVNGTETTSHQAREPNEDDQERLAIKRGSASSQSENSRQSSGTRIFPNSDKMHFASSGDAYTHAWID